MDNLIVLDLDEPSTIKSLDDLMQNTDKDMSIDVSFELENLDIPKKIIVEL